MKWNGPPSTIIGPSAATRPPAWVKVSRPEPSGATSSRVYGSTATKPSLVQLPTVSRVRAPAARRRGRRPPGAVSPEVSAPSPPAGASPQAAAASAAAPASVRAVRPGTSAWPVASTPTVPSFTGSAQRRLRRSLLIHATILYEFSLPLIGRYLNPPPKRPAWPADRSHEDFLMNLPLSRDLIASAIRTAWLPADQPILAPRRSRADRRRVALDQAGRSSLDRTFLATRSFEIRDVLDRTCWERETSYIRSIDFRNVPVAQLDRALASEAKGCRFKSRRAY